jgi:ABC-type multidrug transport system fused ATPase/permease subunit
MFLFRQVYSLLPDNLKKRFWWLFLAMLGLALVETAAVGIIAFYAALISDPQAAFQTLLRFHLFGFSATEFFGQTSIELIIGFFSLLLIAVVICKNVYSGLVTLNIAKYSATVESLFGSNLLETFLYRPYQWHLDKNSSDLVQYINWRIYLGRELLTPGLKGLTEICMLVVLLIGLLLVQPVVSILFILAQGGAGFVVYRFLRKGLDINAKGCRDIEKKLSRDATTSLHAVKDVQFSGAQQHFLGQFKTNATMFSSLFGRQKFWHESPLLALESIGFVLIALIVLFMLFVLDYSPLETTATTALLAVTAWRTLPAFNRVVAALATIRTSTPYAEQLIGEICQVALQGQKEQSAEQTNALNFSHSIEFKNVDFSYRDEQKVLSDFSLVINKGASLGIMGPSGCGKSTFVDLLTGLLTPQHGQVLVDGKVLSAEIISQWQKQIGYVPQFPYIFDGTLAENVAFGLSKQEIDRDYVGRVLKMAAVDFLEQLSDGIDTLVGERGVRLSGGQRQRIAIARALYRQPHVLVFDEATSALDEENDACIRHLLAEIKGNMTLLIVSHRLSTVEKCDEIIDMHETVSGKS